MSLQFTNLAIKQLGLTLLAALGRARCFVLAACLGFGGVVEALSQPMDKFCEEDLRAALSLITLEYLMVPRDIIGASPPTVNDDIIRALEDVRYKVRFRERVMDYADSEYLISRLRHRERCSDYVRSRLRALLDR
jgi:hypothetical protein